MDRSTDSSVHAPTPGWSASVASAPAVPAVPAGAASLRRRHRERRELRVDRGWIPLRIARLGLLPPTRARRVVVVVGVGGVVVPPGASRRAVLVPPGARHLAQSRDEGEDAHVAVRRDVFLVDRRERRVHPVLNQRADGVDLHERRGPRRVRLDWDDARDEAVRGWGTVPREHGVVRRASSFVWIVGIPEGHADLPDRPAVALANEVVAVDRREGLRLLGLPLEVLGPLPSLHLARLEVAFVVVWRSLLLKALTYTTNPSPLTGPRPQPRRRPSRRPRRQPSRRPPPPQPSAPPSSARTRSPQPPSPL